MKPVYSRALYIAETPLQLFSMVCLTFSKQDNAENRELVIHARFPMAEEYGRRIKASGLFDEVYVMEQVVESGAYPGLKALSKLVLHNNSFKEEAEVVFNPVGNMDRFDLIVFAYVSRFVLLSKVLCNNAKSSVMVEDGNGSYSGEVFESILMFDNLLGGCSKKRGIRSSFRNTLKKFCSWVTGNRYKMVPRALYLFQENAVPEDMYGNLVLRHLPITNNIVQQAIKRIFVPDGTRGMAPDSIIFFTSPSSVGNDARRIELEVLETLACMQKRPIICRLHPLTSNPPDFSEFDNVVFDSGRDLWEATCVLKQVSEDAILISFGSSSMSAPMQFAKVAPTLIFLYDLLPNSCGSKANWEKGRDTVAQLYEDKSRIYSPKTFEEFKAILDSVL